MMFLGAWLVILVCMSAGLYGTVPDKVDCYYGMQPRDSQPWLVWDNRVQDTIACDSMTDRGGWIYVLRRHIPGRNRQTEDWNRNCYEYAVGFGDKSGNFWLGLEKLRILLSLGIWEMSVIINDRGVWYSAFYSSVEITSASEFYRITFTCDTSKGNLSTVEGTGLDCAYDSAFICKDWDRDGCSQRHSSAGWHGDYRFCQRWMGGKIDFCNGVNFFTYAPYKYNAHGWYYVDHNGNDYFIRWISAAEIKIRRRY